MQKIAAVTVGAGGASTISFTSIPGTYTDLVLLISRRGTTTGATGSLIFNGDSGTNYSSKMLRGDGSAVASFNTSAASALTMGAAQGSDLTANTFTNTQILIPNYAGSAGKTVSIDSVAENNASSAQALILAGFWSGTAAITSITLSDSFAQNSSAVLYGITKGTGGATAA